MADITRLEELAYELRVKLLQLCGTYEGAVHIGGDLSAADIFTVLYQYGMNVDPDDIVDFDLCWAYDLVDPWGNQYELNCYDYVRVRTDLIDADGITPTRYWPRDHYAEYRS